MNSSDDGRGALGPEAAPPGRTRTGPAQPPVISIAVCAFLVLLTGLVVAWLRSDDGSTAIDESTTQLPSPIAAPKVSLADTAGLPTSLPELFDDRVTLVYLGYLSCPDACPITMDVLSRALATRDPATRRMVSVVFVTTDPRRDDGASVRAYLDRFDSSFIGLIPTSEADLVALQEDLRVPGAVIEPSDDEGDYLVGHATSVFVFDDGVATERHPFGTRQADWERIIQQHVDELSTGG